MKQVKYWGPVVVWMLFIFYFSSKRSVRVSEIFLIQFIFFKTLHLIEYTILYLLMYRAIKNTSENEIWKNQINAFLFSLIYALSDEVHQLFILNREGRLRDVGIDAIGITLGVLFLWKYLPKAPKRLKTWVKKLQII